MGCILDASNEVPYMFGTPVSCLLKPVNSMLYKVYDCMLFMVHRCNKIAGLLLGVCHLIYKQKFEFSTFLYLDFKHSI